MFLAHARRLATIGRRHLLVVSLAAMLSPASGHATPAQPEQFIGEVGERALVILRSHEAAERRRELATLLDEAVDIPLLARLVLGRHWRAASEAQRADYLSLFRAYALQGLTSALSAYTGQERLVVSTAKPSSDGDSLVGTNILHREAGRPPVRIDWRVRRTEGGFSIVDVVAEGVSLLVTNRAEFDSIVSRSGIDGLLREMRSWHEEGAHTADDA